MTLCALSKEDRRCIIQAEIFLKETLQLQKEVPPPSPPPPQRKEFATDNLLLQGKSGRTGDILLNRISRLGIMMMRKE